jgi:hypothetical protein
MDVGDGLGGPDRIDHAHVGMQHRAQHLLLRHGRERQAERDQAGEDSEQHAFPQHEELHRVCDGSISS